jgi:outer membrane protein OmpA-like peptidoglycan-associated protein
VVLAAGPAEGESEEGASEEGASDGSISLGGDASAEADSGKSEQGLANEEHWKRKDIPWIKRWAPEKGMGEVGLYGGLYFMSPSHELFGPDRDLPLQGWKPLRLVNPDLGVRAGYYPIKWFGIEMEGGVIPLKVDEGDSDFPAGASGGNGMGFTVRGSLVGQLAKWSVTPFALIGAGAMGVSSDRGVLGSDTDPALHYGLGAKFFLNRYVMLRLDFRNVVSYGVDVDNVFNDAGNLELLLGLSVTLGREKRDAPVVEEAAPPPPEPVPEDRDGDGFLDEVDACPDEPGVEPDGCPVIDTDGDGILDPDDKCPEEPGTEEFEGCPAPDSDGDGLIDPDDKCPEEPETVNEFQDEDGCPDEVPEEIQRFSGVIEGIYFDTNKDVVKPASARILNKALKVLKDYPNLKLEISGHTDSRGDREKNMGLSRRRAESVKEWLVKRGVDASRITTDGFGPDQPVDSNESKAGRAKNRRIEFKLR